MICFLISFLQLRNAEGLKLFSYDFLNSSANKLENAFKIGLRGFSFNYTKPLQIHKLLGLVCIEIIV